MVKIKALLAKVLQLLSETSIKTLQVSGTTDSNGNLRLSQAGTPMKIVLFGWDGSRIFIPFYYNGAWYARVQLTNSAGSAVTNTAINCTIYYIGGGIALTPVIAKVIHFLGGGYHAKDKGFTCEDTTGAYRGRQTSDNVPTALVKSDVKLDLYSALQWGTVSQLCKLAKVLCFDRLERRSYASRGYNDNEPERSITIHNATEKGRQGTDRWSKLQLLPKCYDNELRSVVISGLTSERGCSYA